MNKRNSLVYYKDGSIYIEKMNNPACELTPKS